VPLDVITSESYSCGHAQSAVSYKLTSDSEQKYIEHYLNINKSPASDASAYIRYCCWLFSKCSKWLWPVTIYILACIWNCISVIALVVRGSLIVIHYICHLDLTSGFWTFVWRQMRALVSCEIWKHRMHCCIAFVWWNLCKWHS